MRLLLADPRVDVNKAKNDGFTPLFMAAQNSHADVLRLLLADPRVDANKANNGVATPLIIAAHNNHPDVVRHCSPTRASTPTRLQNDGATPLFMAAHPYNIYISTTGVVIVNTTAGGRAINAYAFSDGRNMSINGSLQ